MEGKDHGEDLDAFHDLAIQRFRTMAGVGNKPTAFVRTVVEGR